MVDHLALPFVSVVVPNYQGESRLKECLQGAHRACLKAGRTWEIIVVDDCSSDRSVAIIEKDFPYVKLAKNESNLGFSRTMNVGIRQARGQYLLALNNDVILEENYLLEALSYIKEKTDCFAVMGGIYSPSGVLIDAAKYPLLPAKLLCGGIRTTRNVEMGDRILPTLFASGANALYERNKLLELGGFDELFSPFYMEDADLGLTAWRHGWSSYYLPRAKCRHEVSGTIKNLVPINVKAISKRNRWLFHVKHLPFFSMLAWVAIHKFELLLELFIKPRYAILVIKELFSRYFIALGRRSSGLLSTRKVVLDLKKELDISGAHFF